MEVGLITLLQRTQFVRRDVLRKSRERLVEKRLNSVMISEVEENSPAESILRESASLIHRLRGLRSANRRMSAATTHARV